MEYRGFLIKANKAFPSLYEVSTAGQGGKIPAVLTGLFTSAGTIKLIVDQYCEQRELKNGKTRTESGD